MAHKHAAEKIDSKPVDQPPHKVAVVGARGYSGQELARLLLRHADAELVACFANDPSFRLAHQLPEPEASRVATWTMTEFEERLSGLHTVFLATPAEASLELAPVALASGVNVIDLSGAFRLKHGSAQERQATYLSWYKLHHTRPDLLSQAEFGLQPWAQPAFTSDRTQPANSKPAPRLIANPGCYATAVLMAVIPLLKAGLIQPDSLVIDAKSGTTGGGRKASEALLFSEVEGECLPYKVGQHQHWPEIVEAAAAFAWARIQPSFTTHLLNVRRGIIASIYAKLSGSVATTGLSDLEREERIDGAFSEANRHYPLATFGALGTPRSDALLQLKRVVGTARTQIAFRARGDRLYLFSLVDNLLKGAAGQAIENFNRLNDRPCEAGLMTMEGVL